MSANELGTLEEADAPPEPMEPFAEKAAQLLEWLQAAQGEDHVLQRYAAPPSLPPTPVGPCPWTPEMSASGSKPIAVGRSTCSGETSTSVDDSHLGMSRSWGDIEGARSILNLNTPEARCS